VSKKKMPGNIKLQPRSATVESGRNELEAPSHQHKPVKDRKQITHRHDHKTNGIAYEAFVNPYEDDYYTHY